MPPITVIINAGSGSFVENETERNLRDEFKANGLEIDLKLAKSGDEIEQFANGAADSDCEIIVAGGGDGTIRSVAEIAARAGKIFGVLPLGTLNNFSKDLGIPPNLPDAVRIIADNHTKLIDLGEVNGLVFINNSSIGLYPRIVRHREVQQERLGRGKWWSALIAVFRTLRISPFLKVRIRLGDKSFLRKTTFIFVGNNRYEMDLYKIGWRPRLDAGKLSVYIPRRGGRLGVFQLFLKTIFGLIREEKDFEILETDTITIETRKKYQMVAFDGEVTTIETPLKYNIRPAALRVILPEVSDKT
ncbi:MAG: diacylglycerol kinase family protein [Pyrinomonadaceae bacterium]